MVDWADETLAKLQKQREQKQLKDELFLERQKIKKEKGLPLWREVRQKVEGNCETFNSKTESSSLGFGVTQQAELFVLFEMDGQRRQLSAKFDVTTGRLSWDSEGKQGHWDIAVADNGAAQFQQGLVPTTPESIAKQMLNALVFGQ